MQARNLAIVALLAALFIMAGWQQLPGQGESAKPAAVKWEYQAAGYTGDAGMNKRADDGWEVCGAYGATGATAVIIYRRPKTEK